jgi:hypothetical protein
MKDEDASFKAKAFFPAFKRCFQSKYASQEARKGKKNFSFGFFNSLSCTNLRRLPLDHLWEIKDYQASRSTVKVEKGMETCLKREKEFQDELERVSKTGPIIP